MDTKFAIPAKPQKLFFQFNPSETRDGINEKIITISNQIENSKSRRLEKPNKRI